MQQPEAMGVSQALKDKGYALLCVAKATSDLEVETTYEDEVYDLQFGQYFGGEIQELRHLGNLRKINYHV